MRVKNGENGCVHTRDNTKDIDIKKRGSSLDVVPTLEALALPII